MEKIVKCHLSDIDQNIAGAASFGPFHLQWCINWHRGRVVFVCFGSHLQQFGGSRSLPMLEDHANTSLLLVQPGVAFLHHHRKNNQDRIH